MPRSRPSLSASRIPCIEAESTTTRITLPKPRVPKLTARTADRHVLYQDSVQSPEEDARFFSRYYRKTTGNELRRFREDFCGTALLSCEFVKLHDDNRAVGVDLHAPTLAWARAHNLSRLTSRQREHVQLARKNVLDVSQSRSELTAALNFSYSVFKTRRDMARYIRAAFVGVKPGGMFFMDAWGGGQTQFLMKEKRRLHGFTYVWEQAEFDPITHEILCKIHFEFRDGTRMRNAFVYDWRLWTLPELRELMTDAGFVDVHVLWEGTNRKTGKGNGIFRRVDRGGDEQAWVAYVVGRRPEGR
jgi:SAM-dependent methyltransferase